MNTQFSIGCDPEVFLGDATGVRSVIGKIGGSKAHPLRIDELGEGFAVQEDNVALEFNIPASQDKAAFVKNVCAATGFLEKLMKDTHGLHFVKESAVSFPDSEFYDEAAFEFGCEPDYNAWTRNRNPRPRTTDKNLRSCGGHIHIGMDSSLDPLEVVKGCDLFLSVPACLMDRGELRKQLYGKAGAFRKTSYGVEYRPLSNFWIFQPRLIEWAYDNVKRCLEAVAEGVSFDAEKDAILDAVDNNNRLTALKLCKEYNLDVVLHA